MRILIPLNQHTVPQISTLIKLIDAMGPYRPDDSFVFLTTRKFKQEAWNMINHLPNASAMVGLSGTHRSFPLSANEVFLEVMRYVRQNFPADEPWLYLTGDCVPLKAGWVETLERTWRTQPDKPFLGRVEYLPERRTDLQGIERVSYGEPYTLEVAVYPGDANHRIKVNMLNRTVHHETFRRRFVTPFTHNTDLIASAAWKQDYDPASTPAEAVLLTRVYDDKVARSVLGKSQGFSEPQPIVHPPTTPLGFSEPQPIVHPPVTPYPETVTVDSAVTVTATPEVAAVAAPALPQGVTKDAKGRIQLPMGQPTGESDGNPFAATTPQHEVPQENPPAQKEKEATVTPKKRGRPRKNP
jgi:hypothetical protein